MFCAYIVLGAFEWHVLNIHEAMNMTQPLLSGTPLNIWFIWVVGSALVAVIALITEYTRKFILSRNKPTPITTTAQN